MPPFSCITRIPTIAVTALAALAAYGAQQRSFVATFGFDGNRCVVYAPCATFAAALAQTLDGGEIVAVDSGDFGPVTITQSLAIVAPGDVHAEVTGSSGGAAIAINAPGKTVRLQGVTLRGPAASIGVRIDNAGIVLLDRCTIAGFAVAGVQANDSNGKLLLHDMIVADSGVGIDMNGPAAVIVERSRIERNIGSGVRLANDASATITKSVVVRNGSHGALLAPAAGAAKIAITNALIGDNTGDGVHATAGASTSIAISVSFSEIRRNANGIVIDASGGATAGADVEDTALSDHAGAAISASNNASTVKMTISGNTITRNGVGVSNTGATVESPSDNTFNYNGSNGGPLSLFPLL